MLLGRQPGGLETVARRRLFAGDSPDAVRFAWQAALEELAPLLEGQQQQAEQQQEVQQQQAAGGPDAALGQGGEVITICSTQSQGPAEAAGVGEAGPAQLGPLHVACEYLLQWLLSRDDDLEEVARWLRGLGRQAARWPGAAGQLQGVVAAVQRHCQAKFGFGIAC
jgi:hypothetical protein